MQASMVSVFCLKECKKGVSENIGRTSERARFRKCHPDALGARATFFDQHRLGFDSRGNLIDLIENDDAIAEMMLVPVDNFPEVPVVGMMSHRVGGDTETRTSLSWRVEL